MIQKYTIFDCGTIEFEDTKTVKELIEAVFDAFDYYEPLGMDKVTLFQSCHPDTTTGWFTLDTSAKCVDEIKTPEDLYLAYHMPGVFYYAEGGWKKHMAGLGNHPDIPNAVSLKLKFEDFDHTVVINGRFCFHDILRLLQSTDYISEPVRQIKVSLIGSAGLHYFIPVSDDIMNVSLTEFLAWAEERSEKMLAEQGDHSNYEVFELL